MSKIDRYDGDLKAFGADSVSTERTVFGDVTQSNTLDDNLNADFFRGWGIIGVNDFPPIEWFNAIGFTATQILAYLHQMGVAEWNTSQEYHDGSVCIDGAGKVYISKTASNTGNALPTNEDANWKRVLDFSDLNNTALTGVPTAPTAAAVTNTTQLATTEFVKNIALGEGQTRTNVIASRAFDVTYTNTHDRTIEVTVAVSSTVGGNQRAEVFTGGVSIGILGNRNDTSSVYGSMSFSVKPGDTYIVEATGIITLNRWTELI